MRFASKPSVEPLWLQQARSYIGQKEIPGKESNPWLVSIWHKLKGSEVFKWLGSDDSSAPWCGTFVAHCISYEGIPLPVHWYRAKAWLEWGEKLDFATVGCVVVFERTGGGHVGFVVGQDSHGNLMTLGGNQKDRVGIDPFSIDRVIGYRWPSGRVIRIAPLPTLDSNDAVNTNEA